MPNPYRPENHPIRELMLKVLPAEAWVFFLGIAGAWIVGAVVGTLYTPLAGGAILFIGAWTLIFAVGLLLRSTKQRNPHSPTHHLPNLSFSHGSRQQAQTHTSPLTRSFTAGDHQTASHTTAPKATTPSPKPAVAPMLSTVHRLTEAPLGPTGRSFSPNQIKEAPRTHKTPHPDRVVYSTAPAPAKPGLRATPLPPVPSTKPTLPTLAPPPALSTSLTPPPAPVDETANPTETSLASAPVTDVTPLPPALTAPKVPFWKRDLFGPKAAKTPQPEATIPEPQPATTLEVAETVATVEVIETGLPPEPKVPFWKRDLFGSKAAPTPPATKGRRIVRR